MDGSAAGFPRTNPFIELLDIEFVRIEPGQAETRLKVARKHLNPWNYLHGGVFAALADTTMGAAVRSSAKVYTTTNLDLHYIKPVKEGEEVICRGKVIHPGNHIIHAEAVMMVGTRVVATASATFYVLNPGS
ncbi:PaaI family thioesterase [Thermanaeromonas sp. C210]|uniref:PaaI family thioesterase n=1 Tax=Thermanaeromonas sp. C210 TaxID=2731925 RepID=UPI00155CE1D6|nr:PaaI family thioesterase [Thermanaeromonas sp. C210]GFN22492.1 hypothetical protein TAMC210_08080 [Thermanaeromonas sp. C210]